MGVKTPENIFNAVRPEVWMTVGVLLITYLIRKLRSRKKNLPPGPIGLPVVGYLPFLTKFPYLKLTELAEKYGNIFSLYIGSRLVVVLNDTDSIRKALSKDELLARPHDEPLERFTGIHSPQVTSDLREWQEHRRFMLQVMRDFEVGESKMESLVQEEIHHFLNVLEQSKGQPVDITKPIISSASNNICSVVFGKRFEYGSSDRNVMDEVIQNMTLILGPIFSCYFPRIIGFLTKLKLTKYTKGVEAAKRILELSEEKIKQHKESSDQKNIRDYIYAYLLEEKIRKEKGLRTTFSDASLKGSVIFLFNAASETIKSTVTNYMYVMAAFPEVQKKIQKEIREVLGPDELPRLSDQKNMPYTKAVMYEIMRWKTLIPLNPLRLALEDVYIGGYCIPKDSYVIANFWSVHHSPKYWKNPEEFRPERFLNPEGTLENLNNFMPFSVGKRACPGKKLAAVELFLYLVAVLQRFQISFPKGYKPNFEDDVGVTLRLKTFPICFTPN